ncbi:MAG: NfeD family protein [Gemmatimonadales bacterium]
MLLVWLAVALVAIIAEMVTLHFGVIFCVVGAILAFGAALMGFPAETQVVVFATGSVLSLGLLRRRLIQRFTAHGVPSRTDTLLGQLGRVTETIDPVAGTGRVLVNGEDWAARAPVSIPAGATITVYAADGIVLEVAPGDAGTSSSLLDP